MEFESFVATSQYISLHPIEIQCWNKDKNLANFKYNKVANIGFELKSYGEKVFNFWYQQNCAHIYRRFILLSYLSPFQSSLKNRKQKMQLLWKIAYKFIMFWGW